MLRLGTIGFTNMAKFGKFLSMAHKVIFEYWQAADGQIFETQERAEQHEREMTWCPKPYQLPSDASDPCEFCTNNPKNGGSGICWCTLGTKTIC